MKGMGRFDPGFYRLHRPYYPPEAFEGFEQSLKDSGFAAPYALADIGCGTAHSSISVLKTGIPARVIGIDPDPAMLEAARELARTHPDLAKYLEFRSGSGESTGLPERSVVGVLVGSAFHWMDPELTVREFHRVLMPLGLVHLFEYQFPKSCDLEELNEWIRRQFNLRWRAPGQVPRGNFRQVISIFRRDPRFKPEAEGKPGMFQDLDSDELAGLLFSQSRFLHFEATLAEGEKFPFREGIREEIRRLMGGEPRTFDFKLAWARYSRVD